MDFILFMRNEGCIVRTLLLSTNAEYLCFVPRQILSARSLHCNFYEQVLLFRDLMLAELLITSVAALSLVRPAEPLIMSMDKNSSQKFVSIFDPLVGVTQSQH